MEVHLEGCDGTGVFLAFPGEWGEPFMADGFLPRPYGVDVWSGGLVLLECDRAVTDGRVESDVWLFETGFLVYQEFDNQSGRQVVLVVDTHTNSEILRTALGRLNVTVHEADFERTADGVPPSPGMKAWSVAGDGYRIETTYAGTGVPQGSGPTDARRFYAGPPHVRASVAGSYVFDMDFLPVMVSMEGQSSTRELLGGLPLYSGVEQPVHDANFSYVFEGGFVP